jgi:hypothetical protein
MRGRASCSTLFALAERIARHAERDGYYLAARAANGRSTFTKQNRRERQKPSAAVVNSKRSRERRAYRE